MSKGILVGYLSNFTFWGYGIAVTVGSKEVIIPVAFLGVLVIGFAVSLFLPKKIKTNPNHDLIRGFIYASY